MVLSAKQEAALKKARPEDRKALRKMYLEQRSTAKPKAPTQRTANVPRAKPQQRQKTQILPNYLDPMCKAPMPVSLSDGKALAHTSLISKDFKLPAYAMTGSPAYYPGPTILLVTNTGATSTVGVLVQTMVVPGGAMQLREDGIKQVLFNIPTLAGDALSGHPTSGRAMKFSVSVINNTNALKRGGRVTYLNTFQRLPDIHTGGSETEPTYYWDPIVEAVKAAPDRRRINGDNLVQPTQCIGAVVDNIRYHEFNRWKGTETKLEFLEHVLDRATPTGATVLSVLPANSSRSMSTVAFVFDPTDDSQDYSVTVRASYYTRWPLTSVPGQSMAHIPTANTALISKIHESAANGAADLVKVGGASALGALIPQALERMAQPAVQEAERVGEALAADVAGIGPVPWVQPGLFPAPLAL